MISLVTFTAVVPNLGMVPGIVSSVGHVINNLGELAVIIAYLEMTSY